MISQESPLIDTISWEDAQGEVRLVSPELADIIDEIDPPSELNLIKVRYPFGSQIVRNGRLNLPTGRGILHPAGGLHLSDYVRESLSYRPVPLGLIVKNGIEVYRDLEDRIFSIAAWALGLDIGIWEHFGWTTPYSITAGARSLYIVPRVTHTPAHKRLKRDFSITLPPPKKAYDHWGILKEIANSEAFPEPWHTEIIFFPQSWIDKLDKNKEGAYDGWSRLNNLLIAKNLQHSEYARRRSIFEFGVAWDKFGRLLKAEGAKPNSYVIDTLKHLVFLATGGSPGSAPSIGESDMGPISALQKVYLDCYGLKEYIPTIMEPQYFSVNESRPVYYSLQSPTLLESVPKSRNLTSIVDNIRDLIDVNRHLQGEIFDKHLKIADVAISDIISNIQFEYFHAESYAYGKNIRPSREMPENDPALLYMPQETEGRKFADTSPYLHGCIRISKTSI